MVGGTATGALERRAGHPAYRQDMLIGAGGFLKWKEAPAHRSS